MKAGAIIDRAATLLLDEDGIRWPRADLLTALADGQREAVLLNPTLHTRTEGMQCEKGVTQEAPDEAIKVLGVHRNLGPDGNESGRAIRPVEESVLAAADPMWASSERAEKQARHWFPDSHSPRRFRLYPPLSRTEHVEITYSAEPPAPDTEEDEVALPPVYASALVEYLAYRALAAETDAQGPEKAAAHYQQFARLVGGGEQ